MLYFLKKRYKKKIVYKLLRVIKMKKMKISYKKWVEHKEYDITHYPEMHRHTYEELRECCITPDGAIDLRIIDLHSEYVDLGKNGGTKCDVISGPCACGAWH